MKLKHFFHHLIHHIFLCCKVQKLRWQLQQGGRATRRVELYILYQQAPNKEQSTAKSKQNMKRSIKVNTNRKGTF